MSAYLTESLLHEIERVKSTVARVDLITEIGQFNLAVKENLTGAISVCDSLSKSSARLL